MRGCRTRPAIGAGPAVGSAFAMALVLLAPAPGRAADPGSVFHIDRNKNRNQVHYGVRVDQSCHAVGSEPAYNYWLRLEATPPHTEDLRFFQQAAYGFAQQAVLGDGRLELRLRALPERPVTVRLASVDGTCRAEPFMDINGRSARLEKIFVFAEDGMVLPIVRYIELSGHGDDGVEVYEKIVPGK